MPPRIVLRPLCRLLVGHEPIIETNDRTNKSEYVCERCRAVLGDFVTNLHSFLEQTGPEDLVGLGRDALEANVHVHEHFAVRPG